MAVELMVFSAKWCAPCRAMKPALHDLEEDYPEVTMIYVDIDDEPELTAKYGVRSVPTMILIKDGEIKSKKVGAMHRPALEAMVKAVI